jgi:hypothetical protein
MTGCSHFVPIGAVRRSSPDPSPDVFPGKRRAWDSNPRDRSPGLAVFKRATFPAEAEPLTRAGASFPASATEDHPAHIPQWLFIDLSVPGALSQLT